MAVTPEDPDRSDQGYKLHSLLERCFDLLTESGHLAFGTSVQNDHGSYTTLAYRHTRGVQGRVPSPDHGDSAVGKLLTTQVVSLQKLHRGPDSLHVFAFEPEPLTAVRTQCQVNGIEVSAQTVNGNLPSQRDAASQLDVLVEELRNLFAKHIARKAVRRYARQEHSPGLRLAFEEGHPMAADGQEVCSRKSRRPSPDDRHSP